MLKQVIFIGGIHGAGKTSICHYFCRTMNCVTIKQHRALIDVGKANGLHTWKQIGVRHDDFINQAADLVIRNFMNGSSNTLLVDCHYAIRTSKALRVSGKKTPKTYIPDLDYRFVQKLGQRFRIRFVLLLVKPMTAFKRIADRPPEILDYDSTLGGLIKIRRIETLYFNRIVKHFNVNGRDALLIDANKNFETVIPKLKKFILSQNF